MLGDSFDAPWHLVKVLAVDESRPKRVNVS
jgi:hypothetical protein